MARPAPSERPQCDVVVTNNDEVLLLARDPEGFGRGTRVQIADNGLVTALRNRRCVIVGRIPEPINAYARKRGEVLFRCLTTGTTLLLRYAGARAA